MNQPLIKHITIFAAVVALLSAAGCGILTSGPELHVTVEESIDSYHPHRAQSAGEVFLSKNLYVTLFSRSAGSQDLRPELAEAWEAEDEYRRFTFTLREDARWSNGDPILAEDVRRSWLELLEPGAAAPNAWYPSRFIAGAAEFAAGSMAADQVGIAVRDEHTLVVELRGPLSVFPAVLDHHSLAVTHPEADVFSGPFTLESFDDEDDRAGLRPNRRYFAREHLAVGRVTLSSVEDHSEADWALGVPAATVPAGLSPLSLPLPALDYLIINTDAEPFTDLRVRRAFSLALDNGSLVAELDLETAATPAEKPTDPVEARRLLSQTGYAPQGAGAPDPEIPLLINDRPEHLVLAEAVAAQWSRVLGTGTSVVQEDWPTYLRRRDDGLFRMARAGWLGYYPDEAALLEAFLSNSPANDGSFRSARFDELVLGANRLAPGEERQRALDQAWRLLVEEQAAIIPLFHRLELHFVDRGSWSGWEDPRRGRYSLLYLE